MKILIEDEKTLRSLTHEAGRQADYYATPGRGGHALSEAWRRIEQLAFHARINREHILIASIQDKTLPIMPCGPSEQPENTLNHNKL